MREQNGRIKWANKVCEQNGRTKYANKMCEQNVRTKCANKMCELNVRTKCANKMCEQYQVEVKPGVGAEERHTLRIGFLFRFGSPLVFF